MKISWTTCLSFFCSLTFCSLSGNEITSDGVHELAEALQVNQSLQRLKWVKPFKLLLSYWDQIYLTQSEVVCWTTLMSCSLTFCSLESNHISDEGASALSEALQVNQSLQILKWVQPFMADTLGSVLWLFQAHTMFSESEWWHLQCLNSSYS